MRSLNQGLFSSLSQRSRARKMELLREWVLLEDCSSILDIGGHLDPGGVQLIDTYPHKNRITVINIDASHLSPIKERYPEISVQQADARRLAFPDQSFDLVYSNAVIEHVGDWEDQQAMAREVMRVGRRWFVTTPNRWFPFEFHTRLPFASWLPSGMMRGAAKLKSYNHVTKRYESGLERQLRLLTMQEMRQLFPGSRVVGVRITIWPETLIAMGTHG
jgi:ubiquinone/menaquinone biosynthesis C-methylase UbiE